VQSKLCNTENWGFENASSPSRGVNSIYTSATGTIIIGIQGIGSEVNGISILLKSQRRTDTADVVSYGDQIDGARIYHWIYDKNSTDAPRWRSNIYRKHAALKNYPHRRATPDSVPINVTLG
jgi:hypothetical protein